LTARLFQAVMAGYFWGLALERWQGPGFFPWYYCAAIAVALSVWTVASVRRGGVGRF
jgi:hypothetical protein